MIFHERKPSIRAYSYDLLARHLPDWNSAKNEILKQASLMKAGEFGEQRIDQLLVPFLSDSFLLGSNMHLPFDGETIQIDHLILTPSFALIIEAKHLKGHVKLDLENEQMFRNEPDGTILTSLHPSLQTERHKRGLIHLFNKLKINLPVFTFVSFTHPQVHLEAVGSSSTLPKNIFRIERLTMKVRDLLNMNLPEKLESAELHKLGKAIKDNLVPEKIYDTLTKYNLTEKDLLPGVWCYSCENLSVEWRSQRFRCATCGQPRDFAYLESLYVYLTFVSPTIANRTAREFLNVKSSSTMRLLFSKADLLAINNTSKREYKLKLSSRVF